MALEAGIVVRAPARGWLLALGSAPDPAFAQGALGQGFVLEILDDTLRAPCDGIVVGVAAAGHAVTLEIAGGAQILIHCGIDTVALAGAPFTVLVHDGAKVRLGDPLTRVDLAAVVAAGKSLATPIVLVEDAGCRLEAIAGADRLVEPGEPLFEISRPSGATTLEPQAAASVDARAECLLPLPHGLHARPAAAIASAAKAFVSVLTVIAGDRRADARSPTGLMKLGATQGAKLVIEGQGADASAGVEALKALIENGAGDVLAPPAAATEAPATAPAAPDAGSTLAGVAAAPGQALGPAFFFHRARIEIDETPGSASAEKARLANALASLRGELSRTAAGGGIGAAHLAILEDEDLLARTDALIAGGAGAGGAWRATMQAEAAAMRGLADPRLAERGDDFADLEQQLLRILGGVREVRPSAPRGSVVIASDLYPSDLAPLAEAGVAAIATRGGGATSHLAILSAGAGIPAVVALGNEVTTVEEGETVLVDGDRGELRYRLPAQEIDRLGEVAARRASAHRTALRDAGEPCRLASTERIEICANLGGLSDLEPALLHGAEGSGLVRTEFLFLDRAAPPEEDEQAAIYGRILDAMGDRPVIFRTLDIGADKPAPYLPLGAEENPALGMRGIRVSELYPDVLATQLRALLRAAGRRRLDVMAPMIASVAECARFRSLVAEAMAATGHVGPVRVGIMVETPASAVLAHLLAPMVDFMSVGTNDLTQYTLAADRTNPRLAARLDALDPAVLGMIAHAAAGCAEHHVDLGVCGGAAGDPVAAPILIGLGARELSMSAVQIPGIKQVLRGLDLETCRRLAQEALAAGSAAEVRGLGGGAS